MSASLSPLFLSVSQVQEIHRRQLARYGGDPGLRDINLLEMAVHGAKNLFEYGNPDIFDLAAKLCSSIALSHAFVDGNKRTAWVSAGLFLAINGIKIADRPKQPEYARYSDETFRKLMELRIVGEVDDAFVASMFFTSSCANLFLEAVGDAKDRFLSSESKGFSSEGEARAYLTQEFFVFLDEKFMEICQRLRINPRRLNEIDRGARESLIQAVEPKYRREFGF